MIKEPRITLFDLAICLSDACDLINPALVNHHKKVAYIASCIGDEMNLHEGAFRDLVLAGTVHDIGALSSLERITPISFDSDVPEVHSQTGYQLLRSFKPFERVAELVRHHHRKWEDAHTDTQTDTVISIGSDILHIADHIATLIDNKQNILGCAKEIITAVSSERGTRFNPDVFDAFKKVAEREYVWFDAISPTAYRILRRRLRMKTITLNLHQLRELATIFSRIIDFRSKFTAAHSAGVAATACSLARLTGFSKRECEYIRIAGLLHDLGKLAVPAEILEKPGKLDEKEFEIIRSHTYHTYRILDTLDDFDTINCWASFHHEKISGNGYPFHHSGEDLSLGSRIMCVADIFTALSEDRPYRPGMQQAEACSLLRSMVKNGAIDGNIVKLLEENIDTVNGERLAARNEPEQLYNDFSK